MEEESVLRMKTMSTRICCMMDTLAINLTVQVTFCFLSETPIKTKNEEVKLPTNLEG